MRAASLAIWARRLPEPLFRFLWLAILRHCRARPGWPLRLVRTTRACQNLSGAQKWIQVRPAETVDLCFREHRAGTWRLVRRRAVVDAQGLLVLRKATVAGAEGWPASEDGELPLGVFHRARRVPRSLWERAPDKCERALAGTTLNLGAPWAHVNFGHALVDVLPRLAIALDAGVRPGDCAAVLLPATRADGYLRHALEEFGFSGDQIVLLEPGVLNRCERLLQPSHPAYGSIYPAWVRAAMNRFFPRAENPAPSTRLWIQRVAGTRRLREQARLEKSARQLGLHRFEPGPWQEELEAFRSAELIAGPHDATLALLWFAPSGTRVLELCPPDFADDYYASAVAAAGGEYVRIVGRREPGARDRYTDFSVDPEVAESLLTAWTRAPARS